MDVYLSTLQTLTLVPNEQSVSLVLRHSVRKPIPSPQRNFTTGLTIEGILAAEDMGGLLSRYFSPGRVISSPARRCMDTASAIVRGSRWMCSVEIDRRLDHQYTERAWLVLPGQQRKPSIPPEVWELAALVLKSNQRSRGLDILVTHDTVMGVLLGYLINYPLDPSNWVDHLEGLALWRTGSRIFAAWRQEVFDITDRIQAAV